METKRIITTLEETNHLAKTIAHFAFPGMVIGLSGDLGSGKTTFTQFFAAHLGIRDIVSSPTFTILKIYPNHLPLYHMDVYRLADSGYDYELDDYLFGAGVSVVEWYPIIQNYLPDSFLEIIITLQGDDRQVVVKGSGLYESIIQALIP